VSLEWRQRLLRLLGTCGREARFFRHQRRQQETNDFLSDTLGHIGRLRIEGGRSAHRGTTNRVKNSELVAKTHCSCSCVNQTKGSYGEYPLYLMFLLDGRFQLRFGIFVPSPIDATSSSKYSRPSACSELSRWNLVRLVCIHANFPPCQSLPCLSTMSFLPTRRNISRLFFSPLR
jgi:hypothetical protein